MKETLLRRLFEQLHSATLADRSEAILHCGVLLEKVGFRGGNRATQADILGPGLNDLNLAVEDVAAIIAELGKALDSQDINEEEKESIVWALGRSLSRHAAEIVLRFLARCSSLSEELCFQAAIAINNFRSVRLDIDYNKWKRFLTAKQSSPRIEEVVSSW